MVCFAFIGCSAFTQNKAGTYPDSSDPALRTRTYRADYERFFETAVQVVEALPRWTLVRQDIMDGKIFATRQTLVFRFVDDVEIRVIRMNEHAVLLDLFSASRVGKGDLGQNARNIREFLIALDQRIALVDIR